MHCILFPGGNNQSMTNIIMQLHGHYIILCFVCHVHIAGSTA